MHVRPPGPCLGGAALYARIARVVGPVAARHRGRPVEFVQPALARAWRTEFTVALPDATLARCARAIADGAHWDQEMWSPSWDRPPLVGPPGRRDQGR